MSAAGGPLGKRQLAWISMKGMLVGRLAPLRVNESFRSSAVVVVVVVIVAAVYYTIKRARQVAAHLFEWNAKRNGCLPSATLNLATHNMAVTGATSARSVICRQPKRKISLHAKLKGRLAM